MAGETRNMSLAVIQYGTWPSEMSEVRNVGCLSNREDTSAHGHVATADARFALFPARPFRGCLYQTADNIASPDVLALSPTTTTPPPPTISPPLYSDRLATKQERWTASAVSTPLRAHAAADR